MRPRDASPLAPTIRTADGRTRSYRVYVPSTMPVHPAPLVVALHGGLGRGSQYERSSGFDAAAERYGFVVVYPDGIGAGPNGDRMRTWNGGVCCGPAVRQQVDDVGFVRQLLDTIERTMPIDRTRVFAAGHSNGGYLAYRLACELSDRIVAVGLQSGGLGITPRPVPNPVSVLHIHGRADRNVPFDGGRGDRAVSNVNHPAAMWSASTMAAALGCVATPGSTRWVRPDGRCEVLLHAVDGAGHGWMPSSTDEIARFLLAHPRAAE